jgi:hypothetical protein
MAFYISYIDCTERSIFYMRVHDIQRFSLSCTVELQRDQRGEVRDDVRAGQDFIAITGCPKDFHGIHHITSVDRNIAGNTRQYFLGSSQ